VRGGWGEFQGGQSSGEKKKRTDGGGKIGRKTQKKRKNNKRWGTGKPKKGSRTDLSLNGKNTGASTGTGKLAAS